jgi:hypothetical protein
VNERTNMLHANHRDMCKFESTEDDNYLRVKNALVSAVRDLQEAGMNDMSPINTLFD